jgi:hypothetical protein
MNRIQKIVLSLAMIVVVIMILFPPYAAMKLPIGNNIHGSLGYHPIWNPPNAEYAYEALTGEKYDPVNENELSNYIVIFNKVGFIFNMVILIIVTTALFRILRSKRQTA